MASGTPTRCESGEPRAPKRLVQEIVEEAGKCKRTGGAMLLRALAGHVAGTNGPSESLAEVADFLTRPASNLAIADYLDEHAQMLRRMR